MCFELLIRVILWVRGGEMDEAVKRYRLFAMPFSLDSVKEATGERFSRISSGYVLIYTDGGEPPKSAEITESDVSRLSKQDQRWLLDCNIAILAEETKAHEAEILASVKERLDRLEEAFIAQTGKRGGDA